MRLFGGDKMDRVSKMMVTADMGDDMPIQHKIISKAVESAQHKVESINFSMRKSVLEYDDVMNKKRQVIYAERNKILDGKDLTDHITEVMHDTMASATWRACASGLWSSPATSIRRSSPTRIMRPWLPMSWLT